MLLTELVAPCSPNSSVEAIVSPGWLCLEMGSHGGEALSSEMRESGLFLSVPFSRENMGGEPSSVPFPRENIVGEPVSESTFLAPDSRLPVFGTTRK